MLPLPHHATDATLMVIILISQEASAPAKLVPPIVTTAVDQTHKIAWRSIPTTTSLISPPTPQPNVTPQHHASNARVKAQPNAVPALLATDWIPPPNLALTVLVPVLNAPP